MEYTVQGLLEGGNLVSVCAQFFCLVVQGYNNYSFQLVYCALSALSRQAAPFYPYILKWKLVKTPRKVIQYHKIVHRLSKFWGGGGGGGGGTFAREGKSLGATPPSV